MHPARPLTGNNSVQPPALLAWSIWGLGALFYLSGFYQRVAPAVINAELMRDFSVSAAGLGHLTAFYYYCYVAMQIPTGILADSWGPRKTLAAGALVAAVGALVFSYAHGMNMAALGRALIGGSVAVAYVVLLKLAANWFPPRRFALASGMALFFGVVGAVTAGVPLRLLVDAFGWRAVMAGTGFITLGIAAATWALVRDHPRDKGYAGFTLESETDPGGQQAQNPLIGLGQVCRYRNVWLLFLAPGGIVGPVLAFSGLWGVPFLNAKYGLSATHAAAVCSCLMVAWAIGSPVIGAMSDKIGKRKPLYLSGCLAAFLGWVIMVYAPGLPLWLFIVLTIVVGFATGGMIVGFAFAKESIPAHLAGTVSGTVNMGVMLGPTLLQPLMGWVLDANWGGATQNGVRVFSTQAYEKAFLWVVAWAFASCFLIFLTKETGCRQYNGPGRAAG